MPTHNYTKCKNVRKKREDWKSVSQRAGHPKRSKSHCDFILLSSKVLGTAPPGFKSCNPPWLRLSQRPWDHKPLRRQSLSPWQECHFCPLYFTLLGPDLDQLANDG